MKLKFKINDEYLIAHTLHYTTRRLFCSGKNKDDLIALEKKASKISERGLFFFSSEYLPEKILQIPSHKILETIEEVIKLLKEIKQIPDYKKVLKQVKDYKIKVEKEWESNFNESLSIMEEITRLNFDEDEYTVYLTHPSIGNGQFLDTGEIVWGHIGSFENYSTIYLWHEILHGKLGESEISHAIIQLATDNELRVRLNGGKYPDYKGIPDLFPLMKRIDPSWRKYLSQSKENILEFEEKMEEKYLDKSGKIIKKYLKPE